jgi:hypothetical protein
LFSFLIPNYQTTMKKHPIQPLEKDDNGVIRFKRNAIVEHLLNKGGIDLNQLACMEFSGEDREQFAQLIGYSLSGFSELSYVSDETYNAAERMSETEETPEEARIVALEEMLAEIKTGLRAAACVAFGKHPDDLC